MGVVRDGHCYSAPCKFFADGDQSNRIIWYYVPDNRPFYPEMHTFSPRVDDMYDVPSTTYELAGNRPCPRKHYSGRDIWFRAGDHVHGDPDDFLGLALSAKYMKNGRGPWDPCAEPEHLFAEIGLGVLKNNMTPAVQRLPIGCAFGMRGTDIPLSPLNVQAGIALGVVGAGATFESRRLGTALGIHGAPPIVERFLSGLALGIFTHPAAIETRPHGLTLGIVGHSIEEPVAELLTAVAFGVTKHDVLPATETLSARLAFGLVRWEPDTAIEGKRSGVAVGAVGANVATAVETFANGFSFGTVGQSVTEPTESHASGIAIGITGARSDSGAQEVKAGMAIGIVGHAVDLATPGATCGASGNITVGTPVSATISGFGVFHWWKFSTVAGTQYTVTMSTLAGTTNTIAITKGSCGAPVVVDTLSNLHMSSSFTPGAGTVYLQVAASLFGSWTYQIDVTSP